VEEGSGLLYRFCGGSKSEGVECCPMGMSHVAKKKVWIKRRETIFYFVFTAIVVGVFDYFDDFPDDVGTPSVDVS
jgi:hypothetical protein